METSGTGTVEFILYMFCIFHNQSRSIEGRNKEKNQLHMLNYIDNKLLKIWWIRKQLRREIIKAPWNTIGMMTTTIDSGLFWWTTPLGSLVLFFSLYYGIFFLKENISKTKILKISITFPFYFCIYILITEDSESWKQKLVLCDCLFHKNKNLIVLLHSYLYIFFNLYHKEILKEKKQF